MFPRAAFCYVFGKLRLPTQAKPLLNINDAWYSGKPYYVMAYSSIFLHITSISEAIFVLYKLTSKVPAIHSNVESWKPNK